MGQKTHPTGFRLGFSEEWRSRWYARKAEYGDYLVEDFKIRRFIKEEFRNPNAGIARIEIERTREKVTILLHAARPGVIIGKGGKKIEQLRADLQRLCKVSGPTATVDTKINELPDPRVHAQLVAEGVAEQIERRAAFKRAMQRAAEESRNAGALGVRIILSGRLGGAEIARRTRLDFGSIPLSTLRAKVDYGFAEALTTYGVIGVRVWLYLGGEGPEALMGKSKQGVSHGADAKKVKAQKAPSR